MLVEAVISTGGKQYAVKEGDVISVEKLEGKTATFTPLLVTKDGQPQAGKATVKATVVGAAKGEKIVVFKMKAKKGYRKKAGHRQSQTQLKIDKIG